MEMKLELSKDESKLRVVFNQPSTVLTAEDVEDLISHLAERREKMVPPVSQSDTLTQGGLPPVDALMPHLDCALLDQNPPIVVLSIAFQGLGVRNVTLSMGQCRHLADTLTNALENSAH